MADAYKLWNIKNAIKSSFEDRGTSKNLHRKMDKHFRSPLYYSDGTNTIKHKQLDDPDRALSRKDRIAELKKELDKRVKDQKKLSTASRGKGVSIQQQSDYISNYSTFTRMNLQDILAELRQMGCKVTPTKDGYHVAESVGDKKYTNEDIKNMKIKIYEAYHDERILDDDKNELLLLLEKAIENYNNESMD